MHPHPGAYHNKTDATGLVLPNHELFSSVVATILVIVVTAQVALDTSYWTVFNHITIWGSLIFYFILTFFYNFVVAGSHVGTLATAMAEPTFWFTVLLTTVVLLVPVVAWRFYSVDVHPTLTDRARLVQRSARVRHKETQPRPFSGIPPSLLSTPPQAGAPGARCGLATPSRTARASGGSSPAAGSCAR